MTAVGISKTGEGCLQLQSLGCRKVTDVGMSKIAEGYLQIKSLFLSICELIVNEWLSNGVKYCQCMHNCHHKLEFLHCTHQPFICIY